MLRMKDLPPMEREGNGSLYRMDAKQRREAVRLIRAHCSFYDNGNCLYLDDGEEVVCPQITSFSVTRGFLWVKNTVPAVGESTVEITFPS